MITDNISLENNRSCSLTILASHGYALRNLKKMFFIHGNKSGLSLHEWLPMQSIFCFGTKGGGVGQASSRLSTTHGHITDCKLDSVVYAGVGVVI